MTEPKAGELKKLLINALVEPMAALGFTKRAEGVFSTLVAPDILAACHFMTTVWAPGRKEGLVGGAVGLRHQGVERIVAECAGRPFRHYDLGRPTFNLIVVRPAEHPVRSLWNIYTDDLSSIDEIIETEIIPIVRDGFVPWALQFQTLEAVRDRMLPLANGKFVDTQTVVRPLAVAHWMLGDRPAAEALLDEYAILVDPSTRMYLENIPAEFALFAGNLRARMDAGPYEPPVKGRKP